MKEDINNRGNEGMKGRITQKTNEAINVGVMNGVMKE